MAVKKAPPKPAPKPTPASRIGQSVSPHIISPLGTIAGYTKPAPPAHPEAQFKELITQALKKQGIYSPNTLAYAMATAKHETNGTFLPISEIDGPNQAIKNNYSGGKDYYGRGYIQLTHDYNYKKYGQAIGMGDALVNNPGLLNNPEIAANVMAAFFKNTGVDKLAQSGNFIGARAPINGVDHAYDISQSANQYRQALSQDAASPTPPAQPGNPTPRPELPAPLHQNYISPLGQVSTGDRTSVYRPPQIMSGGPREQYQSPYYQNPYVQKNPYTNMTDAYA